MLYFIGNYARENVLKIIRNKHLWYCTVFLDTVTLYHLFNMINILSVPMSILFYEVQNTRCYMYY